LLQDTADVIFHAMAHVSETFVFLLMGMGETAVAHVASHAPSVVPLLMCALQRTNLSAKGIFTGRFSNWSPTFIVMAILFCLVARLFNTFPISFVANFTRTVSILKNGDCDTERSECLNATRLNDCQRQKNRTNALFFSCETLFFFRSRESMTMH
jgi:hypothetical protein